MWYSSRSTNIVQGNLYCMYMCVCAWPNIAQVYSVPYYTSAVSTCNRQFLLPHALLVQNAFHIRYVPCTETPSFYCYAMSSFQFSKYIYILNYNQIITSHRSTHMYNPCLITGKAWIALTTTEDIHLCP